ncbi:glucose-6-phosphate isomerase [uncultured Alistipes sp.]|uniref:glucose-6-phosphate isomerase n=1 Tax=uncultured Alistipes sp. TaxID=538949 RepID=UPI00262A882E|nr:glucose-6-phosphate isomerase [uncultured Alistipes sp.]
MGIFKIGIDRIYGRASAAEVNALKGEIEAANRTLHDGSGAGNDFLGWVGLPQQVTPQCLETIGDCARSLASLSDVIVVIGIGGSYLGTKAVLEAMSDSFAPLHGKQDKPVLLFAGQNLSEDYMAELLAAVKPYRLSTIVISKSGTTTEPAVAFRILKKEIEDRYGKAEAAKRIVAVTDAKRGALRTLAEREGYATFVIPDNVGGRYSVLTPVGLLPLAAAGVDVAELVRGAQDMAAATGVDVPFEENPAALYAAARTALYRKGCKIEILGSYDPKLLYVAEWWKQLYGESEGKDGKGIFPASVTLTADLHSMGQYIQQGERTLMETIVSIDRPKHEVRIESDPDNLDGLNYLSGKRIGEVNRMAEMGTMLAHVDGGVPNIRIELPELNEYYLGALLYFFEKACGMSGYALGVNPFDQPGVEAYKKNMFALLGKPGFEEQGEELRRRL